MKSNEKYNSIKHKLKFFTTILSWTIFVLLVLIAIVLVYYFFTTRIYSKKNSEYRPAFGLYTIISPSMEKTLNIYDVIVNVRVKNQNSIKVGDIITFISTSSSSKGMTITHRVIEISEDENGNKLYKTKGDNNTAPDPKPATFDNILGKVIFKIPQLGRLQSILITKMGWLILVVVPAFIIILYDILKLLRIHGAEKNIEEVSLIDKKKKESEEEIKKDIAKKLTNKYKQRRNKNEIDPLKKSSIIIEVNGQKEKKNKEQLESKEYLEDNETIENNIIENNIIEDNIITKEELISEYVDFNSKEDNVSKEPEKDNNTLKNEPLKNENAPIRKKVRTRKKKKNKKN